MLTEDEAKTKWCPFARVIADGTGNFYASGNRVKNHANWPVETKLNPETARCIGSACMAWRSVPAVDTRERALYSRRTGERTTAAFGDDADWRLVNPNEPEPLPAGYCGLAGRPE